MSIFIQSLGSLGHNQINICFRLHGRNGLFKSIFKSWWSKDIVVGVSSRFDCRDEVKIGDNEERNGYGSIIIHLRTPYHLANLVPFRATTQIGLRLF